MGKPKGKVTLRWSAGFAYSLGLLVTDGSLSKNGRHIDFTSKDKSQVINFCQGFKIKDIKIGHKYSGREGPGGSRYWRVQFGDLLFYRYLNSIGIHPRKTYSLGALDIPDIYFMDFLRGHFDGDGVFYSFWDKRWKSSFMFYTAFSSASMRHLEWLRSKIVSIVGVRGHLSKKYGKTVPQLKFAKAESLKLLPLMYGTGSDLRLGRKYLKIKRVFATIGQQI